MNLVRFQNENVDVFHLLSRFEIPNFPKSALCSSPRLKFYQKMIRYELGKRSKIDENTFFFVFEKLLTTGAKNEIV